MTDDKVSIEVRLPPLPCNGILKYKGLMRGKDLLTIHSCINLMQSIYHNYSMYVDERGLIPFNDPEVVENIKFFKEHATDFYPYVSKKALLNCISLAELILTKYNIKTSSGEQVPFPSVCSHKFTAFKDANGTLRMRIESPYYNGTVSLFD